MADPNHVRIVRDGSAAIAEWQRNHPQGTLHLDGANLAALRLDGANLRRANLNDTVLTRTHLTGADLTQATLRRARLNEADLTRADLRGADLTFAFLLNTLLSHARLHDAKLTSAQLPFAQLDYADLSGADLLNADLSGAVLRNANLSDAFITHTRFVATAMQGLGLSLASFQGAVFVNVDLTGVRDLETTSHYAPSSLDWATIQKSWPLPEPFLRGCGLPDQFIAYLPSLLAPGSIQYYPVFISYSSKDEALASRLHNDLQAANVRCWFAPEDLPVGAKIRPGIDEAIRLHDKLLLILSEHSVASPWVEHEVETALRKERETGRLVLFPVKVDDAVHDVQDGWANAVMLRNIGDFRGWQNPDLYQVAFDRILRDLRPTLAAKGP
jgi:uncharacterized protein YjbI with pentapeptide repeats